MMWGFMPNGGGWLMMIVGNLLWLALLCLLVWVVFSWSGLWARQRGRATPEASSALEILRQRYARGEIDASTFENMRERLESTSGAEEQAVSEQPHT
ncbi:MAG TPA: SHOCT domain-containing protein [Ktedonobacteraceae bacterium]|nr:SHOCT domain-containing protein [Ktedonobacteraceae bacterium]